MKIKENLYTESGWEIYETRFIADQLIAAGSNFLIGNGYLGYRGTFPEWDKKQYVGCIVSDTYDNADGRWTELCNAPNGLYTKLVVDGEEVSSLDQPLPSKNTSYRRTLNLRSGIFSSENCWQGKQGKKIIIKVERFASYADLHLIPMRYKIQVADNCKLELFTGIDGRVWDLNGRHLQAYQLKAETDLLSIEAKTRELGIILTVLEGHRIFGKAPLHQELIEDKEIILRKLTFHLQAGDTIVLEKAMVVYSSSDVNDPYTSGEKSLEKAMGKGYDRLKAEHRSYWERIWDKIDINIEGDILAQVILRFNLYHNVISTPFHTDNLPIGARGLSCQAYQGSAFWDQEIFNLPMFIYTMPDTARKIFIYRYKTLDGARRKAKKLGYEGAFYAWVSGKTGDELCPSYFFTDVLTGRNIRNHFNDWQIHVSPDIVFALWQYYEATGDWNFIEEYGAEIIFEVARFLYSFAYYKKDKNHYELIRVLGPDEYHENVDNNAFTNYQVRFSLDKALVVYKKLEKTNLDLWRSIKNKLSITEEDYFKWKEMAEEIYLPEPDPETGVIEQFSGYFELEDVVPGELEKRLLDKEEYWGWPNGVAVHTQVIKQADVLQLLALHHNYSKEIIEANYKYYEPRNQHGSSLSPAVHSIVAARIGYLNEAYKYFMQSCLIDLFNTNKPTSGGTFIGGIHTAACGGAWQMIVLGFAGMEITDRAISFCPNLPGKWDYLRFKIIYHRQELHLDLSTSALNIKSDSKNTREIAIRVFGKTAKVQPGQSVYLKSEQSINGYEKHTKALHEF